MQYQPLGSTHQFSAKNGYLPLQRAPMTDVKWTVIIFDLKHSIVWRKKPNFLFKSGILPNSHLLAELLIMSVSPC